ncbi:hypothetical protein Aduo_007421 [Ancylostoma duodenale]
MFFSVFRLLLVIALLGAVLAGDPCNECRPRRPHECCNGPSGACCWTKKKRHVEPIYFKPWEYMDPFGFKRSVGEGEEPIDFSPEE